VANIYTVPSGDYKVTNSLNIGGGKGMVIIGTVRVYFTTAITTSGSGFIKIVPGASLELYLGGKAIFSGSSIINSNQLASTCRIYGLPTCTSVIYTGSAPYIGTVYAPQADFTLAGSEGASGSFMAKSIVLTAGAGVHYDEALGH
jgi:hypothetical protein